MVAWNTPPSMTVGQSAEVEFRVTLDAERFATLAGRITAPGATRTEPAELTRRLSAKLESPAFDIQPAGAQPQQVLVGRDAVWKWVIAARQPGEHTLLLTLASTLEDGVELAPLVRRIQVAAAPQPAGAAVLDFVLNNWDKLLTLVLLPVVAWAWRRWRRPPPAQSG